MSLSLVFLALGAALAGGEAPSAGAGAPGYVTPPSSPTEVEVGVYLVALSHVSPPSEAFPTFVAEVVLDAAWTDPRLAFDPEEVGAHLEHFQGEAAHALLERIWWPGLEVENEEGGRTIEHQDVEVRSDGRVMLKERFAVTAHAEVDLRRFPFDDQRFELRLAPFAWGVGAVRLKVDEAHTGYDEEVHTLEWDVLGVTAGVADERRVRLEQPVSVLRMNIHAQRIAGFYLYKLLLPLIVIVIFTWSCFWMRAEPSGGRMERTFVALLTVVAFHHIVSGHLPRIPYVSFVDAVVYACFASVGATLFFIVAIHNAEHRAQLEQARRLEALARLSLPAGFAFLLGLLWMVYSGP